MWLLTEKTFKQASNAARASMPKWHRLVSLRFIAALLKDELGIVPVFICNMVQ